jgi:protein TonB
MSVVQVETSFWSEHPEAVGRFQAVLDSIEEQWAFYRKKILPIMWGGVRRKQIHLVGITPKPAMANARPEMCMHPKIGLMRNLLLLLLVLSDLVTSAQDEPFALPYVVREPEYDIAPQFPGGSNAMMEYFEDSVRYPEPELQQRKGGSVLVVFTVNKKGRVTDARVVNGVAGAPNLAAESIRLLYAMPAWEPATNKGKRVDAEVGLSIPFVPRKGTRPK